MHRHTEFCRDLINGCVLSSFSEEELPREEQGAAEGRGLFLLTRLTCTERNPVQVLDLRQLMLKNDVGELVGYVAGLPFGAPDGIEDDDLSALDIERARRECEGLNALNLLQPLNRHEIGGRDNPHAKPRRDGRQIQRLQEIRAGLRPKLLSDSLGARLESAWKRHSQRPFGFEFAELGLHVLQEIAEATSDPGP